MNQMAHKTSAHTWNLVFCILYYSGWKQTRDRKMLQLLFEFLVQHVLYLCRSYYGSSVLGTQL